MPRDRERNRYRDKRSSSNSSTSSRERRKSESKKSKHKRRSRSRDRSESSSHRRNRSVSRSKHRRRSYSRSVSRERYESKSRRRSSSRSRSKRSRYSRERSRSRSGSRNYSRSTKKHKRHSRTRSRSNSFEIEPRVQKVSLDDTDTKVEKAIKAAAAAGLTMTKLPTYDYQKVEVKEDMPTIQDRNLLDELNSDSFVQKPFTSSRNKKHSQNILIDLNAETVTVPESKYVESKIEDSIINFSEIPSQAELKEMWIKKLYLYRKKVLKGEIS